MRTIIVTVGTSLLSNAERAGKADDLQTYLRFTEPERASAETNSLSRLLQKDDRLVFLHSQTEEGRRAAEALAIFYKNNDHLTELREVTDLQYRESRFKMRGLRSLVATLVEIIRRERDAGREVLVNATGGFKAEIAYATLVGLLFDVPVYYIHEAFQEIIELPPTPISWDFSLIDTYVDFFDWINADVRLTVEVDHRLRPLPDEIRLLLVEEEDYTMLSPTGEAFYEAYKARVEAERPTPIYLHQRAVRALNSAEPSVRQTLHERLKHLRVPEMRKQNSHSVHGSDCLVYPSGHVAERVLYYLDERGNVRVCEVFWAHKDYEKALAEGVYRAHYPREQFEEWYP
ncbi:MAG: putative CRISPR-associated protein [Armatimonadota bacterium]